MTEQTVKCPICGKPYVVFSRYVGDQSACPDCRREARKRHDYPWGKPRYGNPVAYKLNRPGPDILWTKA